MRLLDWDSSFWGFPIARYALNRLDDDGAALIDRECRRLGVSCVYFLAEPSCWQTVCKAAEHGFRFVDFRVDFERSIDEDFSAVQGECSIRLAEETDLPVLRQMAIASHEDSRFFKDPRFQRAKAGEMFARWIDRDFSRHTVLVGTSGDTLTGYITCVLEDSGAGRIGLIAVAGSHRGKGIGRVLVDSALAFFAYKQVSSVHVATQAGNVPAMRLYEKSGFCVRETGIWFHKWFVS